MFGLLRRHWYLAHIDDQDGAKSYFGPFSFDEAKDAAKSGYGKLLESVGNLNLITMKRREARDRLVYSRRWFKKQ